METPASETRVWPAVLAAIAGSMMVGFVPLATERLYRDGLGVPTLLFARYLIALVTLAPLAAVLRLDLVGAARRGAWRITAVGATLGAAQTFCYFQSLRTLETGIAVLLFYTYPAVTLLLERLLYRQRVRVIALLCVATILAGAALIAGPGLRVGTIDPRGLAWAIPGPVIYAVYLTINARLMRVHPPLIGATYLYLGFAATFCVVGLASGLQMPSTPASWLALLFVGTGGGALTASAFAYAMPRLGPSSYAIVANLELVTVVLVGILLLGEVLTPTRAVGGTLVIAGIMTYGLSRRRLSLPFRRAVVAATVAGTTGPSPMGPR